MFGRKSESKEPQAPPVSPLLVQVLTTEYLIEGHSDPKDTLLDYLFVSELHERPDVILTNAQVRPTGSLSISAFTCPVWEGVYSTPVVAIIPRDEAGIQKARKAWKDFKYPFKVEIFSGPYAIQGTIMSSEKDEPFNFGSNFIYSLMTDAEIDNLAPGSKLGHLSAPVIALNAMPVHGFYLL